MSINSLTNYQAIKSATIHDAVGNSYGSVADMIINRNTGVVEFLVIGHGGVLGIGKDYFTIPFRSVDINPNTGAITINVNKEKIESAPRFEDEGVHKWSDQERNRMLDYYGVSSLSDADSGNLGGREQSLADEKHQSYEGSSQVTNQAPGEASTAKEVDYDKMKGTH